MILLFVIINNLIFLYAIGHGRWREQLLNRAAHGGVHVSFNTDHNVLSDGTDLGHLKGSEVLFPTAKDLDNSEV